MYTKGEILKNDLDNDGVVEYILPLYNTNSENYKIFIKAIVFNYKKNKINNCGEITIGSESLNDRENINYETFLNLENIKIIEINDGKYIILDTLVANKTGYTIYSLKNNKLIKIVEKYSANRKGEFTYYVKDNKLFLIDDITDYFENYSVKKVYILGKNKIYTYKNIIEFNENIDNNILYLIESKLLGIEDIESKIKIENINILTKNIDIFNWFLDENYNYILETGNMKFLIAFLNHKYSIFEIRDVKNIFTWSHPTKNIFNKYKIKINRVELIENYPIFYVNLENTYSKNELDKVINELLKANGYWDFELKDSSTNKTIKVYGDKKNKKLIKWGYE